MNSWFRPTLLLGLLALSVAVNGCASAPATPAAPTAPVPPSTVPLPATSPSTPAKSLAGKIIVIDPGHTGGWTSAWGYRKVPDGRGGMKACNSSGTGTRSGYAEHTYNLSQAQALASALRALGATVKLTRTDDTTRSDGLCVNHRADTANDSKADVFISIHADGNLGKTHRGFHVISSSVMRGGSKTVAESTQLAMDIRDHLEHSGTMPRSNYIGAGTGLNTRSDLGTLNFSQRPAVLVEMGNMMNSDDATKFTSRAWRAKAATALAAGIAAYLN